jgi:tetratricopeptide (TPR) repeat protein
MFSSDVDNARQWLIAAFVTSSFLHFYYDGFIWKVSERKTQDNLIDVPAPSFERFVPSFIHAGKWATLLAIVAMLIGSERMHASGGARQQAMLVALTKLTPNVPEAQAIAAQLDGADADARYQLGLAALQRGEAADALGPLRAATKLDPQHFLAHLQLGDALLALNQPAAAAEIYRQAVALQPDVPEARIALAEALLKSDRLDDAEKTLREGLARSPDSAELNLTLAILLESTGKQAEAEKFRRRAGELGLDR